MNIEYWKDRALTAEQRIREAQEQEPACYRSSCNGEPCSADDRLAQALYSAPIPPADVAELQHENAELTRKLAEQPKWVCFHCGEEFTDENLAREHFGTQQTSEPACKISGSAVHGILDALRNAEDQLARYYSEDSDMCRAMSKMTIEHARQIRRSEELGYERGLKAHKEELTKLLEEAKRQAVPEGWKLVPIEPTIQMRSELCKGRPSKDNYAAMLSVAPQPNGV